MTTAREARSGRPEQDPAQWPEAPVWPRPWAGRGRPLRRRLRVCGWLRLETPLHVGGLGHDPNVDLALAVDGQSRLYVPGTSLAGVLRAACGHTFGSRVTDAWGNVPRRQPGARPGQAAGHPPAGATVAHGWASRILVSDGLLTLEPDGAALPVQLVESRVGNGIDRHLGTVAENFLYGRAVVPRGAWLRLALDLESEAASWADEPAEVMVTRLLRALLDGQIRLGAGRTRGLGLVRLHADRLMILDQDLSSLDGLLDAVGVPAGDGTGHRTRSVADLPVEGLAGGRTTVEVAWRPLSPVLVRAAVDGYDTKALPLFSAVLGEAGDPAAGTATRRREEHTPKGTAPCSGVVGGPGGGQGQQRAGDDPRPRLAAVIPGSSIKGVLRTQAELIVRTVLERDAPAPSDEQPERERPRRFRRQLESLDVVSVLFGSAGRDPEPADAAASGSGLPWGRGALGADDCYSTSTIPSTTWRDLLGAAPRTATPTPSRPIPDQPDHGRPRPSQRQHQRPPKPGGPKGAPGKPEPVESQAARKAAFDKLDDRYGLVRADHVAIDRWTGGAASGRLYSTLEPYRVEWEPLRLTLDEERLRRFAEHDPDLADAARALFILVLRDLAAGRVRLGHGTNRGHGDLAVSAVRVIGFPEADGVEDLDALRAHAVTGSLARAWRRYIERTRAEDGTR
ncbi:RAMP superfamily CRISPR-associated protein [Parafrankia sp. EUN1f]|uniref:RAMP superfamily CRISPR-associated protein n=1 Tax=Parafrankia sp. EUN1f TaxID=102897 RepID=UPI0001C4640A|nr:RAMP superfamily CRISPR-associated protein [Parafrankia sp. EUN1f]EFC81116.1 protein of unknown function DUF324 [Parafrankia sp. EUN1f]